MKIPKLIHFIWAGGDKLMPAHNVEILVRWAYVNPSFRIDLWLDYQGTNFSADELGQFYLKQINNALKKLQVIADLKQQIINRISFMDIREHDVGDDYIFYEINRMRPNYGASSDLLRYKILYKYGGVYFDLDVKPGRQTLENSDIFHKDFSYGIIYVDNNSQDMGLIGNDGFICTKNNPLMWQIFQISKQNYVIDKKVVNFEKSLEYEFINNYITLDPPDARCYLYDDAIDRGYIERLTPFRTGNYPVITVLQPIIDGLCWPDGSSPIGYLKHEKTRAIGNDRNWIDVPVKRYFDLSVAIKCVVASIIFEAQEMHMLRIDDHVANLIDSCELSEEECIQALLAVLKNIDFANIKYFQMTFCYAATFAFLISRNIAYEKFVVWPVEDEADFSWSMYNIIDFKNVQKTLIELQLNKLEYDESVNVLLEKGLNYFGRICEFCDKVDYSALDEEAKYVLTKYLLAIENKLQCYNNFLSISDFPAKLSQKIRSLNDNVGQVLAQLEGIVESDGVGPNKCRIL